MKNIKIILSIAATFVPFIGIDAFSDVSIQDWQYKSVEYLSNQGVIKGYEDNTFRPNNSVNRAEALKIILSATEKDLKASTKITFTDVPSDAWFAPFVQYGVENSVISDNGGDFAPGREVNKAEFIKMLLSAFDVDPSKYSLDEIVINDVKADDWFSPHLKFAVKFKLIKLDADGNVFPAKTLNRGETTQIIFNILESGRGLKPQILLNIIEEKLIDSIKALETDSLLDASLNVSVAHNFSEIALTLLPSNTIVQAAEKTAIAVKNLVGAYAAAQNGLIEDIITASKQAWAAADASIQLNPDQADMANEIKNFAASLANKARAEQETE